MVISCGLVCLFVFAAFMYNQELECHRVIADLKTECTNNPLINANLYYGGFKLVKVSKIIVVCKLHLY